MTRLREKKPHAAEDELGTTILHLMLPIDRAHHNMIAVVNGLQGP